MGYTTDFYGKFTFDKPLDDKTYNMLLGLGTTRRMHRDIAGYGTDGEFYVNDDDVGVVDYNTPPKTQPGLWCNWVPTEDRMHLEWNGAEKFYCYVEWLQYLITKVIGPAGYTLSGSVDWQGEERSDTGTIIVEQNCVYVRE